MVTVAQQFYARFFSVASLTRLPPVFNILLVILLGYLLAGLTLNLLPVDASSTSSKVAVTSPDKRKTPAKQQQVGARIAQKHVFGRSNSKPKKTEQTRPQNVPVTRLNLSLQGVLAFSPPELAMAIIRLGSGDEQIYNINDKIVGQATLKEVHPEHVIISRNGKLETLKLPEKMEAFTVNQASRKKAPTNRSHNQRQTPAHLAELPTNPRKLRDHFVKNPTTLAELVTTRPYRKNGKLLGYTIKPKQREDILQSHGLMSGDIVTQVNGIDLSSSQQGLKALRKLVKASAIELVVLRDGVETPVSISLE